MPLIGLLTCSKLPELMPMDKALIPKFHELGIEAIPVIWNETNVDWKSFDCLVFRNTWDYFEYPEEFNQWLDYIQMSNIPTLNSLDIIQWNIHKFYLKELQGAGVAIIPTVFIDTATKELDLSFLEEMNWNEFVIKPAVSGGSFHTERHVSGDWRDVQDRYRQLFPNQCLLVQKFESSILSSGELSMIFLDNVFSHAVIKTAQKGEFRIQTQFGGVYNPIVATDKQISVAEKIIKYIDKDLSYARIDGLIVDGEFLLMEVELIEPDLYMQFAEDQHSLFVSNIAKRISRPMV